MSDGLRTSDFDFELPQEQIAQEPLPRGESRLLELRRDGTTAHRGVRDLQDLLGPGDLLVVNDTRVLKARLEATRVPSGGRVEVLVLEPEPDRPRRWAVLAKPSRRLKPGSELRFGEELRATVAGRREELVLLDFDRDLEPHLETLGAVPLPPYIDRPPSDGDADRYQTVYAAKPGAVAAPTAGLHFDQPLLDALARRDVAMASVTLHVGIGTFRPVSADSVDDHTMHSERIVVPDETVEAVRSARRVVAVGTTVVRALESAAAQGELQAFSGGTELFIRPGYRFRVVDTLLTNFHLPRSTLLMMISAFAGRERVLAAYREAVRERYRFFSYGDAMLLHRREP
ncbi:MAG: tRNA preQ1(34) S-adenosylmethionine ribosyltransferase-isomerase QueA [Acidobacteriota bacterium]